jgi:hypothetical protein
MKRKHLKIILPIVLLICIVSFILNQYPVKSFNGLLGNDETKITKVFMTDGMPGHQVYTNDKGKIRELINLLSHRYYIKSFDQRAGVGGSYALTFYIGDNKVIMIDIIHDYNVDLFADKKNPSGVRYTISKNISINSLDKWYKSLPIL